MSLLTLYRIGLTITVSSFTIAQATEFKLLSVSRIWDHAQHSAFTDLEYFKGQWFCSFREGSGHAGAGDHGKIRVIHSKDGEHWGSAALLESPGLDLRDAKLSVMPDGRLLLNSCEYDVDHDQANVRNNQSVTYTSTNGMQWQGPHRVADKGYWLWQTSWFEQKGYALGYQWGNHDRTRFYHTLDGIHYDTLQDDPRPPNDRSNEHALVFEPDGTIRMLLRRDHSEHHSSSALLGTSRPPYNKWTWHPLGIKMGGPSLIRLPDGQLLTVVRRYAEGPDGGWGSQWTELGLIDPLKSSYAPKLQLPSGGDSSYAGLVWRENILWVSYYSSHEGKTSIYLAKVTEINSEN